MEPIFYTLLLIAAIILLNYQLKRRKLLLKWALLLTAATLFLIAFQTGYIRRYEPPSRLIANGCIEQHSGYVKVIYC